MTKAMARRLRREHSARGGLQFSKTYRKELTEAYVADVNRPRLPPKVRDPQWAFNEERAKKMPLLLTNP